jgi:hypothetical protein
MWKERANGGVDPEGGGADAAAAAEVARRRKEPPSNPSSSGSAASSSSGAAEEERGGKGKQGRRRSKRREDVVRAIRDRLPAAPSCWGSNVSVVRERRGRSERPDDRARNGGGAVEEEGHGSGSGAGADALPAWCCLCPEGDCALEANPSANGKEDPGLRSLLERNDFYSDDCNPHAAAASADANDADDVAGPAADFFD